MMRCFSTLGCPEFTLDEALALAGRRDIPAIELRTLGGTVDLPAYLAARYGTPAALAERLRAQPVAVVAFDTSLKLSGAASGDRDKFLEYVPWAEAAGVRWLRVFDGGKSGDGGEIAEAVATLTWWRKTRQERGWQVDFLVETHDSLFTGNAVLRLLAAAPGTAILWDTHHTWKRGGEDPAATWRKIHGSVAHVHVKDSVSVPSARHPFTYVVPGAGEFPVASLMAALRSDGYRGAVSLEWEKFWHPYLCPLEEALQRAAEIAWW